MTLEHGSLNEATRRRAWDAAAHETYDVLVVGGGVTGCGVALDAASRGLRTLLVEQDDVACGTSRVSSKLIHGGLRYLATGQVGVALESARERHLLLTTIAPHLVRPLPNLVPLGAHLSRHTGAVIGAGLWAGDLLRRAAHTRKALLPAPRWTSATEARQLAPALADKGIRGGLLSVDGQLEDDARLVVTLARTAATHGAGIITGARAEAIDDHGAVITDTRTGERQDVRARVVVLATGVWSDRIDDRLRILPSRGSHLVLPASAFGGSQVALTVPVENSTSRFVFALPHPDGHVLVGLTDEPAPGTDPAATPVPEADETFLLDTISTALHRQLTPADVIGRFAGLRPLVRTDDRSSTDVSRQHLLLDESGRPIVLTGGKLTTYRGMAQDAVDAACRRLDRPVPCRTDRLPLLGAAPPAELARVRAPARLVRRYGTLAPQVASIAAAHPELAEPVAPDSATTGLELMYAALHEGARSTADLLDRRTRVDLVEADRAAAEPVARHVLDLARERQDADQLSSA